MVAETMTSTARILALMDHLGIERAHVATQMPGDLGELAETAGARLAGVVLLVPTRLDAARFGGVAERLLLISGDQGLTVETTGKAAERLPTATRHVLAGYAAAGWSDVVRDRGEEVAAAMTRFLGRASVQASSVAPGKTAVSEGEHAGLTWRLSGQGPALMLFPFFLAPSQWEPAVAELGQHFTVIQVGGPYIGGMAALEDRAQAPSYRAMFHTLIDHLELGPGASVLDVGCGSGALDRMLASRFEGRIRIVAADLNPFFLKEAKALAVKEGLADQMTFVEASATDLPFEDATFDGAFSVTVLEECDADKAIAEMARVVKPGGHVGIVVRAIDIAQWWNLDLPPEIAAKASVPAQSVAKGGVADRSLYRRMLGSGLVDLQAFPAMITLDRPGGAIWRYREDAVLPQLTPDELAVWQQATAKALAEGLLMQSHVMHVAVGRKP